MTYDLQPLVEAYGRPWREFRTVVRTNFNLLNRYKVEGLPFYVADRFATLCDLHPVEVWGYDAWTRGMAVINGSADLQGSDAPALRK
jgi:hypothetical protein